MLRFISRKWVAQFPCFAHLSRRPSTTGSHWPTLDGVRGIAALLVLFSHWKVDIAGIYLNDTLPSHFPYYLKLGHFGVAIFFVLSGFLLVQPYCRDITIISLRSTVIYLCQRGLRILPMYWVLVFFLAWHANKSGAWIWDQLTFYLPFGILWTVKQEIIFYVLLPIIVTTFIYVKTTEWRGILLLTLASLVSLYFTSNVLPMRMLHGKSIVVVRLYIDVFMMGMAAGCFVHAYPFLRLREAKHSQKYGIILSIVWSTWFVWLITRNQLWSIADPGSSWTFSRTLTAAFFVLLVGTLANCPLARVCMFLPFRAIGIVGYSFYLWHMVIMSALKPYNLPEHFLLLATLICCYVISCISYSIVEVPFMALGRKLKRRNT